MSWAKTAGAPNPNSGMPNIPSGPLTIPTEFPDLPETVKKADEFNKIRKCNKKFLQDLSDAVNDLINAAGTCG